MRQVQLSTNHWMEKLQQNRLREYREMEPDLVLFRASLKEVKARAVEDAVKLEEIERAEGMDAKMARIFLWASDIARLGREGVRFERWRYARTVKI